MRLARSASFSLFGTLQPQFSLSSCTRLQGPGVTRAKGTAGLSISFFQYSGVAFAIYRIIHDQRAVRVLLPLPYTQCPSEDC